MENGKWRMKVQILRICPIEHNCTLHTTPVPKGSRPGALPEGAVSRRLTEGVKGAVWPKTRLRESLHLYIKPRRTPQRRRSAARQLPHIASLSAGRHKDRPSNARQPPFLFPVPCSLFPRLPVPCSLVSLFPVACSLFPVPSSPCSLLPVPCCLFPRLPPTFFTDNQEFRCHKFISACYTIRENDLKRALHI